MKLRLRRRRQSRTLLGRLVAAWPLIRLALRFARWRARATRILVGAAVTAIASLFVRRARRRRGAELPTYSPTPEPTPAGFGGGTRETGYEAGPGTQTERELEAEKGSDDDGAGKSPTFEEPPPVEDEPPTKT